MLKSILEYADIKTLSFWILLMIGGGGCKKFVEVDPPTNQLVTANVFTNDGSATSAVTGVYTRMTSTGGFASGGPSSVTFLSGLSADEFINSNNFGDYIEFANNALVSSNVTLQGNLWSEPYQYIYTANAILEGLSNVQGVSTSVKQQLIGESKFIRAFCYFHLVNLFGDVPLYLTSDYQLNATASRSQASLVYQQIISDLKDAQNLLAGDYSNSNGERVRPNKWVATAFLARVYLYEQKWDSAEAQATEVINDTSLFGIVPNLDSVFLANSTEAIWQLLPVLPSINTQEGSNFILTAPPTSVSLTTYIMNAFESGDLRLADWVSSYTDGTNIWYFPFKYKIQASSQASSTLTEYSMVLRLAEQYLIRAEARAQQNNIGGAQADLNIIRNRAGLSGTSANDQASLVNAVLHERQVELFSEWGHRWLDLIRTNQVDVVLGSEKLGWKPTDKLYPIPASEIKSNSKISQNDGY